MGGKARKQTAALLLLCLTALLLGGCASPYRAEYYHETDYAFPEQRRPERDPQDKVEVKDYAALETALLNMVYAGQSEGRISFDPSYGGDSRTDLEAVCGTMHRKDALWAYCVQNARFEISHIITHDEADIHIEYAASALPVEEVLQLNYAAGLEKILRSAMENDSRHLVILIRLSSYSADAMDELVRTVYRADPSCAPTEPRADVNMYSGTGRQRLYDIELDYRLDTEELQARRAALADFDSEALLGEDRSDGMRAHDLARWLSENCEMTTNTGYNSAWDALIGGKANSEGLALAYVQLCRQQGLNCRIVYGQRHWRDHCWNIIELEGQHYHVDLSACAQEGMDRGFLLNDSAMWAEYRWDTASYDICAGDLDYWTLTGRQPETGIDIQVVEPEPEETPQPTESQTPEEGPEPEGNSEPTEEPDTSPTPEN